VRYIARDRRPRARWHDACRSRDRVRAVAWLPILGLSALVVASTLPYLSLGGNFAFLGASVVAGEVLARRPSPALALRGASS